MTNYNNKANTYGTINSWDIMKFIAVFLMVVDHIGYYIFFDIEVVRALGRSSMMIFMFLTGWTKSRAIKVNLIFIAIITQMFLVSYVQNTFLPLNVLITIISARLLLNLLGSCKTISSNTRLIILFASFFQVLYPILEYAGVGYIYAAIGYIFRNKLCSKVQNGLLLLYALLFYMAVSQYIFKFNHLNFSVMALSLIVISILLWKFQLKAIKLKGLSATFIMIISRNALNIYFIHQVFFLFIRILLR